MRNGLVKRWGIALLALAAVGAGGLARAQAQAASDKIALAIDLQEQIVRTPVTVRDREGRQETREIPVTVYRPPGDGPFPLVIFNHGRMVDSERATQGRSRPEHLARWLVNKGFVVLVPTRAGYGETYGDFDPEDSGPCDRKQFEPASQAAADQVRAVVDFARRQLPYVDASRWVVAGASMGGNASVATVWSNPPGLLGGINFVGGAGGHPRLRPGNPCSPDALAQLWAGKAPQARAPMLWLYWENDKYLGAEQPLRWHQAWVQGGAQAELHMLPPIGDDGHGGVFINMDRWVPLAEDFLTRLGLGQPYVAPGFKPTGFADVRDTARLPGGEPVREAYATRFLPARSPRAFAIGDGGAFGVFSGDWAVGRALGLCQRQGQRCRLYAVNDNVVWEAP